MPAALGAPALTLLIPSCTRDHPLVQIAVTTLRNLEGNDRVRVLSALLGGPFADGDIPRPVLTVAAAADLSPKLFTQLVTRLGADCPSALATAAWNTGDSPCRASVLASPSISPTRLKKFLDAATAGDLGALLDMGAEFELTDERRQLVTDAVIRRSRDEAVYDDDRMREPRDLEQILTRHPVDRQTFVALSPGLPRSAQYNSSIYEKVGYDEQQRLHGLWSKLAVRVWRTQAHLLADAVDGSLFEGAGDDREQKRALLAWTSAAWDEIAALIDVLNDADLTRIVTQLASEAEQNSNQANLLATAVDAELDTESLFKKWSDIEYERRHTNGKQPSAKDREKLREVFDLVVADDLSGAVAFARSRVIEILGQLKVLTADAPSDTDRPYVRIEWASSPEARERLWQEIAPHVPLALQWPIPTYTGTSAWANLARAALISPGLPGVSLTEQDATHVRSQAQAWLSQRPPRSRYLPSHEDRAVQSLLDATAPPAPSQPQKPRPEDLWTGSITALRADPTTANVDRALDLAVAQISFTPGVDRVLDLAEVTNPADALERLTARLEQTVRAQFATVGAHHRSRAAASILQSRHLTRTALLDLPAFAVFGSESQVLYPPPGPGDHIAALLLDLIGDDPGMWKALARLEVANKGAEAWTATREVLSRAGITL